MRRQGRISTVLATAATLVITTEATANDFGDNFLWSSQTDDIPHVLTPVRLQQPTAEVPASVTVLDAEFIARTGIHSISQLLRHVPGMIVAADAKDNGDAVVYHGGPSILPKSFQVLIDGRSQYRSGVAAVAWENLPVAAEEIKRIEIVRGPSATSYGTNAYQAVINIITQHPQDTSSHTISAEYGNNADGRAHIQTYGGGLENHWRISALSTTTDHLKDINDGDLGCVEPCPDNRDNAKIIFRGSHELSSTQTLSTSISLVKAFRDVPRYDFTRNYIENRHIEVGAQYEHELSDQHQLKISAYALEYERNQRAVFKNVPSGYFDPLLRELDEVNPVAADQIAGGMVPSAIDASDPYQISLATQLLQRYGSAPQLFLAPMSGEIHSDTRERRTDLEIQDTYAPNTHLTIISGVGYRKERVESAAFYGGQIDADQFRIFGNINWRPSEHWALHSGVMYEQEGDDTEVWSAKFGANYLLSPVESVRFVFSRAGRTPDFLEQRARWQYIVEQPETDSEFAGDVYYDVFTAPGDLKPQIIHSFEIGYFAQPSTSLEWDIKLFREELTNVIYQYPSIRVETVYDGNSINYTGAEGQLAMKPFTNTELRFTSTFIHANSDATDGLDENQLLALYAPRVHSSTWYQRWPAAIRSNLSVFITENGRRFNGEDQEIDRQTAELHIFRDYRLSNATARINLKAQRDFTSKQLIPETEPFKQSVRYQIGAALKF